MGRRGRAGVYGDGACDGGLGWGAEGHTAGLAIAEFGEGAIPFTAGGFTTTEDFLEGVGALAILDEGLPDGILFGFVLLID